MHYVYIIQSAKSDRFYIGSTKDITKRLKEHNKNITRSTKHKGPWNLVLQEELDTKCEAIKREHYLKNLKGNSVFKKLAAKTSLSSSPV